MSAVLYLIRHAIAEPATGSMSDEERRLTDDGVRKMREIAAALHWLGVVPDVVLSSPLRRAQETAEITVAGLSRQVEVGAFAPLGPGHAADEVGQGLGEYRGAAELMLVGHEPGMGELASFLLTGSSGLAVLPFKKGGVAAIAVPSLPPRSPGELLWFLTPKQLRVIGHAAR